VGQAFQPDASSVWRCRQAGKPDLPPHRHGPLIEYPKRRSARGGISSQLCWGGAQERSRMILNTYAVLDAFLSLLRLGLGLLVLGLGLSVWVAWLRSAPGGENRKALEDRCYLLFLLAGLLLALNVVSWPIMYLLLQSYVPEWPGV